MTTETNPLVGQCPLKTPPFNGIFEQPYFTKHYAGYSPNRPSEQGEKLLAQMNYGKTIAEQLTYKNRKWKFVRDVDIDWKVGQLHCPEPILKSNFINYPAHFHSELSILGEHFHLDFYAVGGWGLGRSLREVRVYKYGALINRGGCGNAYIASFRQNLPLPVQIKNHLLLFHQTNYDNGKEGGVLVIPASLWERQTNLQKK